MDLKKIEKLLEKLDFDKTERAIYMSLSKNGPSTVLNLSREIGINRTRIYRRIENLVEDGFLKEVIEGRSKKYELGNFNKIENIYEEKKEEVDFIKENFSSLKEFLSGYIGIQQPGTKVNFYRGREGIKQLVWNTLRAEKEVVGLSYRELSSLVGVSFMKKWRNEFVKRDLIFRDIYSDEYKNHQSKVPWDEFPKKRFQSRYVPSSILNIDHQTDIYGNYFAIYNWHEGEIFGVEIQNPKVARLQKQVFEILWKQGEKED